MTRVAQWFMRRQRYIRRHLRYTNAKTRPRKTGGGVDYSHRGGHQSPLGVVDHGVQPPPRVKYSTYLAQRPHFPPDPFHYLAFIDGTGYADPPHVRRSGADHRPPEYHYQEALGPGAKRAVRALSRPLGRMADNDVHSFRAWTFWKRRRVWPVWDPKSRTPVDPYEIGEYDDWTV